MRNATTAFSAAVTHRSSDKRGGANGGRLALAQQKDWSVNRRSVQVIAALRGVMADFNGKQAGGKKVSLADLIVLGGCAALEKAAHDAGVETELPFTPGRRDTTQDLTDMELFEWLKPVADGFRNYLDDRFDDIPRASRPKKCSSTRLNSSRSPRPNGWRSSVASEL